MIKNIKYLFYLRINQISIWKFQYKRDIIRKSTKGVNMVTGIVSEYNPFHNGHLHHINHINGYKIAIMSGDFVQRGEIAFINKWKRAEMAVKAGVDLVLELPTIYATSSAELFSYAAISILHDLNIVDYLSFGSECGDINVLHRVINQMDTKDYTIQLKQYIKEGYSYPKASEMALNLDFTFSANNILAIEYMKAINDLNSHIMPMTIKRTNDYHSEKLEEISSATAIRLHYKKNKDIKMAVPSYVYDIIEKEEINDMHDIFPYIVYKIASTSVKELSTIKDVTEGLEYKIKKELIADYESFLDAVCSKRYTKSRIRRILINILLNIRKDDFIKKPPYTRVLGFNENGKNLLHTLRKTSSLPIITNINKFDSSDEIKNILQFDILASDIRSLINEKDLGLDYKKRPFIY